MSALDVARLIRFWMRKVRELRIKLALANSDYADLKADYATTKNSTNATSGRSLLEHRVEELEAALGRSEDRRYQP